MTENGSNHYYVICFNLKNGDIDILDNIDNGIEDISDRYGKYAQVLVSITKNEKNVFYCIKMKISTTFAIFYCIIVLYLVHTKN